MSVHHFSFKFFTSYLYIFFNFSFFKLPKKQQQQKTIFLRSCLFIIVWNIRWIIANFISILYQLFTKCTNYTVKIQNYIYILTASLSLYCAFKLFAFIFELKHPNFKKSELKQTRNTCRAVNFINIYVF